ncbi:hypothetical protein [Nocardioides sp.]|uniref:hypothetical protein n=1 Tax=Nocardioides sp. TaxID=35761 RepID=UPI002734747A|nr:hypothetical protein [Nocardioides sp.]MDP3889602.1 hypothetical protein [Nocardioides sp.]
MAFIPVSGAVMHDGAYVVPASQVNPQTDVLLDARKVEQLIRDLGKAAAQVERNRVRDIHIEPQSFGAGHPNQRAAHGHAGAHRKVVTLLEAAAQDLESFADSLAKVVSDFEEVDADARVVIEALEEEAFRPRHSENAGDTPLTEPDTAAPETDGAGTTDDTVTGQQA